MFPYTSLPITLDMDSMTMWPPELRKDLRKGLLAKRTGDLKAAASYLSR